MNRIAPVVLFLLLCPCAVVLADTASATMKTVATDDFEKGVEKWEILGPQANWTVKKLGGNRVLDQVHVKKHYQGPHRSPYYVAILKDAYVTDFVFSAKVKSTSKRMNGHRDACLFFGYQDPAHFYYVHMGLKADPHANQIFIVNKADRKKITKQESKGTPWDEHWHNIKIVRKAKEGLIEIYFDDMKKPAMTAIDKRFAWGRVGIGTFDDTTQWDDIKLQGVATKPPANHVLPGGPALNIR